MGQNGATPLEIVVVVGGGDFSNRRTFGVETTNIATTFTSFLKETHYAPIQAGKLSF